MSFYKFKSPSTDDLSFKAHLPSSSLPFSKRIGESTSDEMHNILDLYIGNFVRNTIIYVGKKIKFINNWFGPHLLTII